MQSMARIDARWGDCSQQDSQEFMHALLEGLQTESNRAASKPLVCVGVGVGVGVFEIQTLNGFMWG